MSKVFSIGLASFSLIVASALVLSGVVFGSPFGRSSEESQPSAVEDDFDISDEAMVNSRSINVREDDEEEDWLDTPTPTDNDGTDSDGVDTPTPTDNDG
ncbi:MAG: hypothetical protein OXS35_03400, partial [Dehalococcoidia bacterium]|nr:hypothetical protein [Dehalococcoidia bacterium]